MCVSGEVFMYICMCVAMESVYLSLCEYMSKDVYVCIYEDLGERCIFKCVCELWTRG